VKPQRPPDLQLPGELPAPHDQVVAPRPIHHEGDAGEFVLPKAPLESLAAERQNGWRLQVDGAGGAGGYLAVHPVGPLGPVARMVLVLRPREKADASGAAEMTP
jgi:hypothetical protein